MPDNDDEPYWERNARLRKAERVREVDSIAKRNRLIRAGIHDAGTSLPVIPGQSDRIEAAWDTLVRVYEEEFGLDLSDFYTDGPWPEE